jgi:hypothetical protein
MLLFRQDESSTLYQELCSRGRTLINVSNVFRVTVHTKALVDYCLPPLDYPKLIGARKGGGAVSVEILVRLPQYKNEKRDQCPSQSSSSSSSLTRRILEKVRLTHLLDSNKITQSSAIMACMDTFASVPYGRKKSC